MTHRAESYGIVLGTLAPGKPVSKGLYDEIPYNVSLTSSYHSLGHFLTAMGKGDRLFAARNLALTPAASKTDPTKTINATFRHEGQHGQGVALLFSPPSNGWRLSCGALQKDSFLNVRAPSASSAC